MKLRITSLLVVLGAVAFLAAPAFAAETVKGKVVKVNATEQTFTFKTADAKDLTFHMDASSKIRLNNQDAKLADLQEGAEVTVIYEVKGGKNIVASITGK